MSARLLAGAAIALGAFVALGRVVSGRPPGTLDSAAAAFFFGQATPVAAAITSAGLFPAYVALCVAALVAGIVRRAWLPRALLSVATVVVAWQTSDVFKALFHRARPNHWLAYHETSYSYASGHAVLVTAFWGVWAAYALAALPPSRSRALLLAAIAAWILAIGWSRLALGAHYLSDVAGGYLLGLTFVLAATAIARRLPAIRA